jgi:hypothetical protein
MTSHALAVIHTQQQNETLFQIDHALRHYFELEAACLIANGEAYKPEMKAAEQHVVELLTRVGGQVTIGNSRVEAHEAFEGDKLMGRWFTVKGDHWQFSDAANAMAHTRLLTPWKRGLLLEAPATTARKAKG